METEVHSGTHNFTKQLFCTYKQALSGLPSFCRLLMLEAFEYYDQSTDIITITSLDKLARDHFQVDAERGRQKENVNGDTLRNAFRTIKKFKSDYFLFTTVNQQIVIDMPFMRELKQSFFTKNKEVAAIVSTDVAAVTTLSQHGEETVFDRIDATIDASDLAAASFSTPINVYAQINPTKFNNNNKPVSDECPDLKKQIADDFYPAQFVIEKAQELGFSKVIDEEEINKFILFNKASGNLWKCWDYVYLIWLQRDAERERAAIIKEQELQKKPIYSGSKGNESIKRETVTQRVIAAWSDEELEFCPQTRCFKQRAAPAAASIKILDFDTLDATV